MSIALSASYDDSTQPWPLASALLVLALKTFLGGTRMRKHIRVFAAILLAMFVVLHPAAAGVGQGTSPLTSDSGVNSTLALGWAQTIPWAYELVQPLIYLL